MVGVVSPLLHKYVSNPSDAESIIVSPWHIVVGPSTSIDKVVVASGSTVIYCLRVLILPDWSVAVQVTSVVPTGKTEGALLVTVALQLSDHEGFPKLTFVAEHSPTSATTVLFAG